MPCGKPHGETTMTLGAQPERCELCPTLVYQRRLRASGRDAPLPTMRVSKPKVTVRPKVAVGAVGSLGPGSDWRAVVATAILLSSIDCSTTGTS